MPDQLEFDPEFACELLVVQVESTLFRVNQEIFSSSPVFADMFDMPQPPATPREGSSAETPLKLEGIRKEDFKNFLRLFFPVRSQYTLSRLPAPGKDAWLSVLHLASLWQMTQTRQDAINKLGMLINDPGEKLVLSDQYDVPAWAAPALLNYVSRAEPISEADVEKIGLARALKVGAMRERRLAAAASEPAECPECGRRGALVTTLNCRCAAHPGSPGGRFAAGGPGMAAQMHAMRRVESGSCLLPPVSSTRAALTPVTEAQIKAEFGL